MSKNLTYIGVFTLFLVIVWIAVAIHSSLTSSTISGNLEEQIKPLEEHFNTEAINVLRQKNELSVDLSKLPQAPKVTPIINQPAQINLLPTQSVTNSIPATSSGQVIESQQQL